MNFIKTIAFFLCASMLVAQTVPIRNPQIQGASGSIISGATLTNNGTFTNSGTLGGAGTFDFSSGTVTMPATQILTNVTLNGTITFADNIKQTFNPGATYAGINVGSYAGVPSTLANGDLWYDSVADALKARISNTTVSLGAGGGGGGSTTFAALTDVDLTSLASGDMLKWNGTDWINRTAANVRTDLGLVIGTNVQAYDPDLTTYAGITPSANVQSLLGSANYAAMRALLDLEPSVDYMPYTLSLADLHTLSGSPAGSLPMTNGLGGYTGIAASANVQSLLGAVDYSAMRTQLSLVPGTNVQAYDATLAALAALNNTKGVLAQTGSDTFTRLQTPVNVKVYGATGDARKFTDGVTVNGTNTITSATGDFTSADVGKVIWGTISAGTNVVTPRTVATVVSSTELTVSGATLGASTGVTIVIGTDDTAAIQAAVTAAEAMPSRGAIYLPGGGYITTDTPFVFTAAAVGGALPSIIGDGSASVTIFPSPTSTLEGNDYIFSYDALAGRKHMEGFTVDGTYGTFSSDTVMFFSSSSNHNTLRDVWIKDFTSLFAGVSVASSDTVFQNCHIEGMWGGRGIYCNGTITFVDSYAGNCGYFAIDVANGTINIVRGTLDEAIAGTVQLQNSTGTFDGGTVYAGASYTALSADATSVVRAVGTRFIPFGANNNCTGMSVASGGTARLANCILTGSGTGYGLNNSGTVYDVGGNTFTTTTGTAPVDALSSVVSVAHGGTGATALTNLITLGTMTTGNYVADVAGTANEITSTHTPGEGSTATLSLPSAMTFTGKTVTGGTYSAPTISGAATLSENASIALDPAGSADGKYSGTTVTGTAGATLAFGDVVVLDVTDSRWELADANSAAAADGDARALLGICVLAAASDGSATTILLHGIVRADTAFPALTVGAPVYVGETAGDAVVAQPTTADVLIRVIGHALTADEMFFNPDNTWITHL